jgi:hypothetical protein
MTFAPSRPFTSSRGAPLGCALILALAACSSKKDPPEETGSTACNRLIDDGPTIGVTVRVEDHQDQTGGTIVDGVYELTEVAVFNPPSGYTNDTLLSAVFQITGNTIQQVGHINGEESRYTSTYTTLRHTITTTDTCPEPATATFAYTATPTGFRIGEASTGLIVDQVFTKR